MDPLFTAINTIYFFTTSHATIYSTLTHNAIIDTVSESAHFSDTYFTTNQRLHRCNRQGNMYWKQINEIILNLSARLIIGLMKNCSSCYPLGMSLQSTYEKENRVKTLPAGVCCDSAEMASSLPWSSVILYSSKHEAGELWTLKSLEHISCIPRSRSPNTPILSAWKLEHEKFWPPW